MELPNHEKGYAQKALVRNQKNFWGYVYSLKDSIKSHVSIIYTSNRDKPNLDVSGSEWTMSSGGLLKNLSNWKKCSKTLSITSPELLPASGWGSFTRVSSSLAL